MEKIKLNKNIYSLESINQSIKDFKQIALIRIKEEDEYYNIELDSKKNVPYLKEEFTNYVFGISKNKKIN